MAVLFFTAFCLFFHSLSFAENIRQQPKDKISIDIRGMDIVDVLKTLSNHSGMNMAIGRNVTGKVTLFLKDVNVDDVFEIILLANDLACERKGSIINIMTQKDYETLNGQRYQDNKEAKFLRIKYANAGELAKVLNQIKSSAGRIVVDESSNTLVIMDTKEKMQELSVFIEGADLPTETRIFSLNYAQADKLSPKIQEALTRGVGVIKTDERTNKIVVTDYPDKIKEISEIISAFDEKTPQVLIDAQIIKVTPSDAFTMGVDWDYFIKKHFDIKSAMSIGAAGSLFIGTPAITPVGPGQYKVIIDILRTIGDTKVLSSPRIMSLNNQEAKIHVGVKDAYITSTTSQSGTGTTVTSQSVNFVDTGIQLYVTPNISRDGFVTMKIKPEISDSTRTDIKSEGQVTQIPIVTTSEAETTVTVKDGVTVIIGGLSKDKRDKTVKKIPLLGDIPGLGFLFRSTSDSLTKDELVILLTPHIMSGENTFSDFSEVKPRDGAVAKMIGGKIITQKVSVSKEESTLKNLSVGQTNNTEYSRLIIEKIRKFVKANPSGGIIGEINLAFNLAKDGRLIGEPKIISASDSALIPYAIKAVKDAAPFYAFPDSLNKPEEIFRINLSYQQQ